MKSPLRRWLEGKHRVHPRVLQLASQAPYSYDCYLSVKATDLRPAPPPATL